MLDLVLINKEWLVANAKLKGSRGCSDHEMVEFRILRTARRAHSKLTTLDFRRAGFGLFKDLLCRVPWNKSLEGREAQESWLIFKDHLLHQGSPPPSSGAMHPNKEEGRQAKMLGGLHG